MIPSHTLPAVELLVGRSKPKRTEPVLGVNSVYLTESVSRKCVWTASEHETGPVGQYFVSEHCPATLTGGAPTRSALPSSVTRSRAKLPVRREYNQFLFRAPPPTQPSTTTRRPLALGTCCGWRRQRRRASRNALVSVGQSLACNHAMHEQRSSGWQRYQAHTRHPTTLNRYGSSTRSKILRS